jgi:hypothetical protein
VKGACHHPLAAAGLAVQQNRGILGRDLVDTEEDIFNGRALADDLAAAVVPGDHLPQLDVLDLESLGQLLDLDKSALQGRFRLLALLDLLGES